MTVKMNLAGILIMKIKYITKIYYKNLTKWLNMLFNRRKKCTPALDLNN